MTPNNPHPAPDEAASVNAPRTRRNCPERDCRDGQDVIVGNVFTVYRCPKCGEEEWL